MRTPSSPPDPPASRRLRPSSAACGCLALLGFLAIGIALVFLTSTPTQKDVMILCLSNEKQIGLALSQYVEDNDGKMPDIAAPDDRAKTWRTSLLPYVPRSVFHCPGRRDQRAGLDGLPESYAANYTGNYGATRPDKGDGAFAGPGSPPLSLSGFPTPAETIAVVETANNLRPEFNVDAAALFGPDAHALWAGHRGGGNYIFVDGHVKHMPPMETYRRDAAGKTVVNHWYRENEKPLSANGIAVLNDAHARFPR